MLYTVTAYPTGVDVGPDERVVVMPGAMIIVAKPDIPDV